MGAASLVEVLINTWPTIYNYVDAESRYHVYEALVKALENQDADTLGEVVECAPRGVEVDPVLIQVLISRGHLGEDWE